MGAKGQRAEQWYYQLTPHDLYDWDLQNSPVLTTANGQPVVIDGGKAGILAAGLPGRPSAGGHDGSAKSLPGDRNASDRPNMRASADECRRDTRGTESGGHACLSASV
jgi:hypothetical protein